MVSRLKGKDFLSLSQHFCDHSWNSTSRFGLHDRKDEFFTEQVPWSVTKMVGGWRTYPVREGRATWAFPTWRRGDNLQESFPKSESSKRKKKKIIFNKRFHSVRYHFLLYFCFWRMLLRVGKGIYYLPGLFPQELLIKS